METGIVDVLSKELSENAHVRQFDFKVEQTGNNIVVRGVVRSFYQRQMADVSIMRILQNLTQEFRLMSEIQVIRAEPEPA